MKFLFNSHKCDGRGKLDIYTYVHYTRACRIFLAIAHARCGVKCNETIREISHMQHIMQRICNSAGSILLEEYATDIPCCIIDVYNMRIELCKATGIPGTSILVKIRMKMPFLEYYNSMTLGFCAPFGSYLSHVCLSYCKIYKIDIMQNNDYLYMDEIELLALIHAFQAAICMESRNDDLSREYINLMLCDVNDHLKIVLSTISESMNSVHMHYHKMFDNECKHIKRRRAPSVDADTWGCGMRLDGLEISTIARLIQSILD